MSSLASAPRSGPVTYELATWGVRAAAYLIDLLVFVALAVLIAFGIVLVESDADDARRAAETIGVAIVLPISLAYAPLLMVRRGARNGQTLGKQVMRIRVVRESGEEVTLGNAVLREVIGRQLLVAFTYGFYAVVDYLWPLWDRSRQCLHDKVAQTRVVRLEPTAGHPGGSFTAREAAPAFPAAEEPFAPQEPAAHEPAPVPEPAPAPAAPPRDDRPVRDGWLPPSAGR
ncbi:RDD family protein [Conexibacter arvalis]|uniref:Putative RDD family membrane protein YckC n=1 Tax=Conexibacter arvalis TaxID=912552 RepID=A0A840I9F4_9ACTN|nr:putative RDD family membrane protein YckC [Conexibacter arvalis]